MDYLECLYEMRMRNMFRTLELHNKECLAYNKL